MALKKGDSVRQVLPAPFAGTVEEFCVDQESGEIQYRVECHCEEGHAHSKWFKAAEIEAVSE